MFQFKKKEDINIDCPVNFGHLKATSSLPYDNSKDYPTLHQKGKTN